jgi:HEPN domain-containing protein
MPNIDPAQKWFDKADEDLTAVQMLIEHLHSRIMYIIAYHCQQAGEKTLKGFLVFNDIDPPRTHDLVELCRQCIELDQSFESIQEDCNTVTPYGIATKYPNEPYLDIDYTKVLFHKAQKIYNFCKMKCFPDKN